MERPVRGAGRELRQRAKEMRREPTAAEQELWRALRGCKVAKVRRQHPLDRFVLDFYVPSAKLCIEVDGEVHDDPQQRERDEARTEALATRGIRVLRFRNEEVLRDTLSVIRRIEAAL